MARKAKVQTIGRDDRAAAPAREVLLLEQILGQGRAIDQLRASVASGRIHHAWIFHGPIGVGKFTTALAFGAMLIDPEVAPGVGTPVRGGLSYREAHLALELVAEAGILDSIELVEVNPIRDHENTTAGLAVELAASALGDRIL